MNYEYLKKTETEVQNKTGTERKYWFDKVPDLIDSLFEVSYFIGWDAIDGSESFENNYQVLANQTYQSVPYTMSTIGILIQKGYYNESTILSRTLFEMFVKLRYFFNHKDKCLKYAQRQLKVQYKVMFEEFAPGLYDILYSKLLSEFAHGGIGIGLFHNKIKFTPNIIETIAGCFYDEFLSNVPINACTQLYFGYLNYLPILFNKYKDTVTTEVNQKRLENLEWLANRMEDQMKNHPKVKDFYNLLNPLIR